MFRAPLATFLLLGPLTPCCADPAPVIHYAPAENLEHVDVAIIDRAEREIDPAAYVLTDLLAMPARSSDASVWFKAVRLGTAMIYPLIRRLHRLQMQGGPGSMRRLGGSGGEHHADKVH
jgi:hypothetical protein